MDRVSNAQAATMPVEFKLNGRTVVGRADETIIETARSHGVEIPHLCYKPGLRPDGNCRACVAFSRMASYNMRLPNLASRLDVSIVK